MAVANSLSAGSSRIQKYPRNFRGVAVNINVK